jgi:hypothetical protein
MIVTQPIISEITRSAEMDIKFRVDDSFPTRREDSAVLHARATGFSTIIENLSQSTLLIVVRFGKAKRSATPINAS